MANEQERELLRKHNEWMNLDVPSQSLDDAHVTAWMRAPGSLAARYLTLQVERAKQDRTPDGLAFDSAWDSWEKVDELEAERVNVKLWPIDSKHSKDERALELERIDVEIAALIGDKPALSPATPAPVVAGGGAPAPMTTGPAWSLKKPIRFQGYGKPLYDFLKAAHTSGQPTPKARDLLDAWKTSRPLDVVEVTDNGLKYYDAKGGTKPADLDAIRKAIGRMTQ